MFHLKVIDVSKKPFKLKDPVFRSNFLSMWNTALSYSHKFPFTCLAHFCFPEINQKLTLYKQLNCNRFRNKKLGRGLT